MSGNLKASLAAVLSQHNARKFNGTTASAATRDKRSDVLFDGFKELRQLGYRLDDVRSFRGVHMQALARHWEVKGYSPSTIQGRISIFRLFAGWIGKQGMIEASWKYVASPASVARTTINRIDKSWSSRGVDAQRKIAEVRALDGRVGMALELQLAFGLRAKEAYMLRPHQADQGTVLAVTRGAKNGRPRTLRIDTPYQRDVLDRAKGLVSSPVEAIGDPAMSLAQVKNHYYRVLRQAGVTRRDGITSHGLRHQAANDQYDRLTGQRSPVRGGGRPHDPDADHAARIEIAENLGHSREDVTTHYLGRVTPASSSQDQQESVSTVGARASHDG